MRKTKIKIGVARSLKVFAYISYMAFPIYAIAGKFPMWREEGGIFASLGVGAMLIGVILAWTLRNALSAWTERVFGKFVWSQTKFWIGGTLILLVLNAIGNIISDLLTVWIWGCVGMGVGMLLSMIAKMLERSIVNAENTSEPTNG